MFGEYKWVSIIISVVVVFALGFGIGSRYKQAEWDRAKLAQSAAVEKDRSQKQNKSDTIDEQAAQQIQDLMVKNAQLQEQLDVETTKPAYDCIVPSDGIRLHNNTIRADKR